MSERIICECCQQPLAFQWSDTHGVGVCISCGLPYTIFHYEGADGERKRVEKPPEIAITRGGLEIAKRYWSEHRRRVFPACYDMGFLSGRECSYSGATVEDYEHFNKWYAANERPAATETKRDAS